MAEMIKSEVDFAAVVINEIVEAEPSEAGYKQYRPSGRDFAMWRVPAGFEVRVGDQRMTLSLNDARLVRDWLREATYDLPLDRNAA